MSPRCADARDIARPIYAATQSGDISLLDAAVADDIVEHPLNPGQIRGRDALKQTFGGLSKMVPDLSLKIQDMIAAGDKVAVRSIVRGTPAESYLGVPANGRSMEFEAIDIWRIEEGRIIEGWHVEDFVRVLIDWGVVPLPARSSPGPMRELDSPAADAATDVVREWYTALHRGRAEGLAKLFSEEFVNSDPLGPSLGISQGIEGARADIATLREAFPDLDVSVADMFAEHDKVVARVIVRRTQLGPLPGIDATRKRMAVMGNEIWRVSGKQIVDHWGRFEDLDLLMQLGVLPDFFSVIKEPGLSVDAS